MRRVVAIAVLLTLIVPSAVLAVGKEKVMYVGGTITSVPEKTEGRLVTGDEAKMLFVSEKGGSTIEIPYKEVQEIEYGQKAGRRVMTAILLSPLALFSKRRRHYMTLSYKDGGKDQAVVFELGKDIIRQTLAVIEARSGQKVIYQDEEAAKNRAQ